VTPWLSNPLTSDAVAKLKALRQQALSDADDSKFDKLLDESSGANSSPIEAAAE
jgi:hypothetical protein